MAEKSTLLFIDSAVDFIRTYADRTHHGKEEDILFRELGAESSQREGRRRDDRAGGRAPAGQGKGESSRGRERALPEGPDGSVQEITAIMEWLAGFYPGHIRKEDSDFFPRTEGYFSAEELKVMLESFRDFDRKMIHEKYEDLVNGLRPRRSRARGGLCGPVPAALPSRSSRRPSRAAQSNQRQEPGRKGDLRHAIDNRERRPVVLQRAADPRGSQRKPPGRSRAALFPSPTLTRRTRMPLPSAAGFT